MESLFTAISIGLILGLVLGPIYLALKFGASKRKYKFITYLAASLALTAVLTGAFAWWSDKSNSLLLSHYHYNAEGMNTSEIYRDVRPEHVERVKEIESSMGGIGWPLKAMIVYAGVMPYVLLLYPVTRLWIRSRSAGTSRG